VPMRDLIAEVGPTGSIRRALGVTTVLMLECPACFSTWVGLICGALIARVVGDYFFLIPISLACYSAGTSFLLGKITKLID
jgi:hypothetical protein